MRITYLISVSKNEPFIKYEKDDIFGDLIETFQGKDYRGQIIPLSRELFTENEVTFIHQRLKKLTKKEIREIKRDFATRHKNVEFYLLQKVE